MGQFRVILTRLHGFAASLNSLSNTRTISPSSFRCAHRLHPQAVTLLVAFAVVVLPGFSVLAVDVDRPAQLRFVVQDDQGQAVSGARFQLLGLTPDWLEKLPAAASQTTDAAGKVLLELSWPVAAAQIIWDETVRVTAEGHLPTVVRLRLFPDAEVEQKVTLEKIRMTRLRLRGPQNEPLARIGLHVTYVKEAQITDHGHPRFLFTDEHGECLWQHGPVPDGFHLSGRPETETLKAEPLVTVTYQSGEVPRSVPVLHGKLLHADDSVAAGWLVARKVRFVGAGGDIFDESRYLLQVEDLVRVGADGNFEADAESVLVVVSPDGRPFLYELAPQTWGPGIRRVTLRVPDVRRVHHGQVRVLFGNLVPGLPVEIETVRSNGLLWEIFSEQEVPSFRRSLWNARATDGTPIRQIRTAADGRYSVPIYFGSAVRFRGFGNGGTLVDPAGLGADEFSVWKPDTKYKFEKSQFEPVRVMKLVFEDEQGQPVQGILCRDVPLYSREGEIIMRGASCGEDARGQYLFVNSPFDEVQIEIECSQKRWLPQRINIKNRGAAEQVVHVKLDPSKRRGWPLAGRVLNPDGTGAQRARVLLYKATSEKRNRYGNDYLHLDATTDNDGKFLFDAAPDQCYIEIEPVRNEWGPGLQGWSSPLAVDSQTRDVQIRLQRGGSLKLLLPTDLGPGAEHFYLRRENVPDDLPLRLRNTYFTRGADQHERLANVLEPGSYLLDNSESDTDELLAELGKVRAEVRVGEQTVIDLRDQKIPAARALAARPKSWTTIVVKHDNQVVSGAEVVVLANVARADDLSRWIAGTASDDRQVRETAIRMLQRAGAQAVDAIRSSSEKLDRDELFKSFEDVVSDGLYQVIRDLSDDQGQVRCEVETGRNCIAVARVRGRMIGWLSFVSNGETLSVPLQPARTLVIQREEAEPLIRPSFTQVRPMFPAVAHIRLEEPTSKEVRGLIAVLCEVVYGFPPQPGWVQREAIFDHLYSVRSERRGEWVVEDLPMGAVCTIALPERRNDDPDTKPKPPDQHRITIERGSGVQFAKW